MFENLGGESLDKLYIDSIFFIIGLTVGSFIVCKNYKGPIRIILLFYVFITFSTFNIFIKPVQDYNIPIPRTFIFYFKIFKGLSLYDIFLIFFSFIIIISYLSKIKEKGLIQNKNILNTLFVRDFLVFFIGLFGAYLYESDGGRVEWEPHYRLARGVLTAIVLLEITQRILRYTNNIDKAKKILEIFSILNLINIISEFSSSRFLSGISWERGGHSVFLIDQTNSYLLMIYAPLILIQWPLASKTSRITGILTISLLFLDYHKISYFQLGFGVLMIGIIGLLAKRNLPKRIKFIFPIIIIGFIFTVIQLLASGANDMKTRSGQLDGVINAFENHPISLISGMGIGGMFKRQTLTDDGGEIKAIDIEKYSDYQNAIQVPFLFQIKEAGIVGGLIVVIFFFIHLKKTFRLLKLHWYFAICSLFIATTAVLTRGITYVDPQAGIYFSLAYITLILNIAMFNKLRTGNFKTINF